MQRLITCVLYFSLFSSLGSALAQNPAEHPIVTEFVVTPTAGEFIEVYNPAAATIDLSQYYVTDAVTGNDNHYTTIVQGGFAVQNSSDFMAKFPDSTQQDVTARAFGSTYTSSNSNIITIDQEGLVTATDEGIGFVTVNNEGATAVAMINVLLGDPLTTVEGFVQDENGSFFEGVEVMVNVGGIDTTDSTGYFSIPGVTTTLGLLTVTAQVTVNNVMLFGLASGLTPMPAGITDAGIITFLFELLRFAAPLPTARGALIAETIGDSIYVVGGSINWSGTQQFTSNEVYDPTTDSWSFAVPVPDLSTWDPASAVVDGKLYLLGGWPGAGQTMTREYDPTSDSWSQRASIPQTGFSWGHAAAVVNDQVYVIGGSNGSKVLQYDPGNNTWTTGLAPIPINRTGLAAGVINNLIYVVGTGTELQIYDSITDIWTLGDSLPVNTNAPSVAVLDGKLNVFGGASNDPSSGGNLSTIQIYDPATNSWELGPGLQINRSWSAATVHQGRAYIFGGFDLNNNAVDANEVLMTLGTPVISVSPTMVNFGDVQVGNTGGPVTITIANIGSANLTVSGISTPAAPFSVDLSGLSTGGTFPVVIAPSASETFTTSFSPTSAGAANATIMITSDDVDVNVTLQGNGTTGGTVIANVKCPSAPPENCPNSACIEIDMTGSTELLGSFTGTLTWDPTQLDFVSHLGILAGFTGNVNTDSVAFGKILFNGASATGASGVFDILCVDFDVIGAVNDTGTVSASFSAMSAAVTFTNLLPSLTVNDCSYTIVAGCLLGDVNGDGFVNSTDCLIILSFDVGLPIPQPFLDLINAGCCDVNMDGFCNSTDALICLSFDVGLPVPFPVGQQFCP